MRHCSLSRHLGLAPKVRDRSARNSIKSDTASSRGLGPGGNSEEGLESNSSIAFASSAGAFGNTRRLIPKLAISGMPPTLLATHGVPHDEASRRTLGTPSEWLGRTNTSAARYQRGSSDCLMVPANQTRPVNPSWITFCSSTFRNGPFPTMTRRMRVLLRTGSAQAFRRHQSPSPAQGSYEEEHPLFLQRNRARRSAILSSRERCRSTVDDDTDSRSLTPISAT